MYRDIREFLLANKNVSNQLINEHISHEPAPAKEFKIPFENDKGEEATDFYEK